MKFLPGRANDDANPALMGLSLTPPTTGMLPLLASTRALTTSPPIPMRMFGLSATISSAKGKSFAELPLANLYTILILRSSTRPWGASGSLKVRSITPSASRPNATNRSELAFVVPVRGRERHCCPCCQTDKFTASHFALQGSRDDTSWRSSRPIWKGLMSLLGH